MHDKTADDNSTLCHICNEELGKDRVRDHCHLSGKFRGKRVIMAEGIQTLAYVHTNLKNCN